jgi:transcriptional regulator with XRE-family HTH domain
MPELLGDKLRYLRNQHSLTQVDLAHRLALASYTHITKIEAGQRSPSIELLVRIAKLFDQPTDYFLRDTIPLETAIASIAKTSAEDVMPRLVGLKVRTLREKRGWGQTALARELNLARRGYVSNLEAGRKMPSLDLVVQMAERFGITTDYLLLDTVPVEPVPG